MKADEGDSLGMEKAHDGRTVLSNGHVKAFFSPVCIPAQHNYVGKYIVTYQKTLVGGGYSAKVNITRKDNIITELT